MTDVLLVRVDGRQVGLAVESLVEVIELERPFAVPSTTPAMRGVVPVRGHLLPVFHLGAALEGGQCPEQLGPMAVVVRLDHRAVCLEVDDAEEVSDAVIGPLPDAHAVPGAVGVVRREGAYTPIIDVTKLGARLLEPGRAS